MGESKNSCHRATHKLALEDVNPPLFKLACVLASTRCEKLLMKGSRHMIAHMVMMYFFDEENT